jgi:polyphosphate kinase 2 (PPK2 family)
MAQVPRCGDIRSVEVAKGKKKKNVPSNESANSVAVPTKMARQEFEDELSQSYRSSSRGCRRWAVAEGARVIVVFEGRDTAGKGGVISRIIQRCSPRVFKHVALLDVQLPAAARAEWPRDRHQHAGCAPARLSPRL